MTPGLSRVKKATCISLFAHSQPASFLAPSSGHGKSSRNTFPSNSVSSCLYFLGPVQLHARNAGAIQRCPNTESAPPGTHSTVEETSFMQMSPNQESTLDATTKRELRRNPPPQPAVCGLKEDPGSVAETRWHLS